MSIKIIRCRTNPREVEAVEWDGTDYHALEGWGCTIAALPDENGSIWINELGEEDLVLQGWWIVKDPDENAAAKFWVEPPEKFAQWFTPMGQS